MVGSPLKSLAIAAGVALGGSGLVILVSALFIGMLVLSLIPLYTSNNSQEGFGEIYRIPGITLKAIYTQVGGNFTGGNILNTAELSSICTSIFRAKGAKDFYACVATNFTVFGPTNDTSGTSPNRRRRGLDDGSIYEIGDILLLYSNTCSNRRALSKWFTRLTSRDNSSCLARRATACRAFITTPNNVSGANQWLPVPAGYSQVVYTNGTGCAAISISKIYNLPYSTYPIVNTRYNITKPTGYVGGDCRYESIVSQSYMKTLVDSLMTTTVSGCTNMVG